MNLVLNPSDYTGTYEALADHLALDFVNTVSNRLSQQRHDWLDSYPNLLAWCGIVGLLDASQLASLEQRANSQSRNSQNALADARQLREAMYALFSAAVSGSSPDPTQLNTFNHYLRRASAQLKLAYAQSSYTWQAIPNDPDLDAALWPIAHAGAELLIGDQPQLSRVGQCQGEGCGWLFIDHSRNHSRRWCDMNDCGNRAKANRFYQRNKLRASQPNSNP